MPWGEGSHCARNPPPETTIEPDRNPEFWRRHARRYDRAIGWLNRRFQDVARRAAKDVAGCESVLEVAAGTGLVTVAIAPGVKRLVATDASVAMLAILRARLDASGLAQVETRVADAMALNFEDASFDAVVAANLLHLLDDPRGALREMRRMLRPGGLLCVPTFAHGEGLRARWVSRLLAARGFPVVTRFSGTDLSTLVKACGFVTIDEASIPGILPVRYLLARRA